MEALRSNVVSEVSNAADDQKLLSLTAMLSRFTTSSQKLEERYELLRQESEALRAEIRRKDIEIEGARRLAMLGEAAARLAHEVRNPLGAISLFVSLLKQDLAESEGPLALVEDIGKSITALNAVVTNTLHFAKERKRVCTPLNIHSIIQEVASHFSALAGGHAQIELTLQGDPFLRGDSNELRQAVYNLLTNAFQAIEYRGHVAVSLQDKDDKIEIVIRDSGPGISKEMLSRLFEPFATDKQSGTGLGLAIVKDIIGRHGGSISVQNNGGAEFTIILPRNGDGNLERRENV